jgi:aminopeptidase N
LSHQWFGDAVTARQSRAMWLHEGFATYLEEVYRLEVLQPDATLATRMRALYGSDGFARIGQWGAVSVADPTRRFMLEMTPYYRGALALYALRLQVGETAFWTMVRQWAQQPVGTSATTEDFITFAAASTGADLTSWARAWIYGTAKPVFPHA